MKNVFIAPIGKHAREEKKYPEYLQAVEDFLAANPTEGEIVTHEWLDEHLDLRPGTDGYAMRKMSRVQGFRKELLEKYQVDLKNVLGKGYYIVPAIEQTATAMRDTKNRVDRAYKDGLSRCINVRQEQLTDEQKEANQMAIAILAGLKATNSSGLSKRKIRSASSGAVKAKKAIETTATK